MWLFSPSSSSVVQRTRFIILNLISRTEIKRRRHVIYEFLFLWVHLEDGQGQNKLLFTMQNWMTLTVGCSVENEMNWQFAFFIKFFFYHSTSWGVDLLKRFRVFVGFFKAKATLNSVVVFLKINKKILQIFLDFKILVKVLVLQVNPHQTSKMQRSLKLWLHKNIQIELTGKCRTYHNE